MVETGTDFDAPKTPPKKGGDKRRQMQPKSLQLKHALVPMVRPVKHKTRERQHEKHVLQKSFHFNQAHIF